MDAIMSMPPLAAPLDRPEQAASLLAAWQAQRCKDLIIEAAHRLDSRDLAGFAACFADKGVLVRPGGEPLVGPAAIEATYRSRDPLRITQHLVLNQRVALAADGLSAQVWSKVLLWTSHDSSPLTPKGREADRQQQIGEFDDLLILQGSTWRIARRQASFLLFQAL
jgi:hypothetical protein